MAGPEVLKAAGRDDGGAALVRPTAGAVVVKSLTRGKISPGYTAMAGCDNPVFDPARPGGEDTRLSLQPRRRLIVRVCSSPWLFALAAGTAAAGAAALAAAALVVVISGPHTLAGDGGAQGFDHGLPTRRGRLFVFNRGQ